MKTPRLVARIAALAAASLTSACVHPGPPVSVKRIEWQAGLAQAYAKARDEGKPLAVYFAADWSPFCRKIETEVFSDPRVEEVAGRAVFVRVEPEKDEAAGFLAERLDLRAYPLVAALAARGESLQEMGRVEGYFEPGEYGHRLAKALGISPRRKPANADRRPIDLASGGAADGTGPAEGPTALSGETLPKFLGDLGFEVKSQEDGGRIFSTLTVAEGDWTFFVDVSLSSSGRYLWLTATLDEVGDPAKAPPEGVLRLLEKNNDIGPAHFAYLSSTQRLTLNLPVENRDLTPALFRYHLDSFLGTIKSSYELWDTSGWPGAKPPEPAPPGPKTEKPPDAGKTPPPPKAEEPKPTPK